MVAWDKEEVDITDKDLLEEKIKELNPKVIINTSAYNAVDKCEKDAEELEMAKKINSNAVAFLADIALDIDAILVHYSTDYVFDGKEEEGYQENSSPFPVNNYSRTKYLGEKELIKRSGKGLKWYLIRTSKLFGPSGESDMAKKSFFDIMLDLSQKKSELEVVDEELSCFTYTPDLAQATKNLIASDNGYGIYHIVNSGAATWYQATQALFEILGKNNIDLKPVPASHFPRPAKRPQYSVLVNTKLEPLRSWQEALREYYGEK